MPLSKAEIDNNPSLDEGIKHAVAAGVMAAAALTGSAPPSPKYISKAEQSSEEHRMSFKAFNGKHEARAKGLAAAVTEKYAVGSDLALKIARLAVKHEKPGFPQAEDILAVVGIESSFKPHAESGLKKDPAIGLMQVRPGVWGLDASKLKSSVEEQIRVGSEILHGYYKKLKSKESALQAYNVGLTNYMKKKGLNPRYVPKFEKDREMYEDAFDAKRTLYQAQQDLIDQLPENIDVDVTQTSIHVYRRGYAGTFDIHDGTNHMTVDVFNDKLELYDQPIKVEEINEAFEQYKLARKLFELLKEKGYKELKLFGYTTDISPSYGKIPGWAIQAPKHKIPFAVHVPFDPEPGIAVIAPYRGNMTAEISTYDYLDGSPTFDGTPEEIVNQVEEHIPVYP